MLGEICEIGIELYFVMPRKNASLIILIPGTGYKG